jgi:transglutaminase-like putative cysteine protease
VGDTTGPLAVGPGSETGAAEAPGTWRLAIRHTARYHYDDRVPASSNEARVIPSSAGGQVVLGAGVEVSPQAVSHRYRDYWGNTVHAFDVREPHSALEVTSSALVETGSRKDAIGAGGRGPEPEPATWRYLESGEAKERFCEVLSPTRYVCLADVAVVANRLRAGCAEPAEAIAAAVEWVHSRLAHEAGPAQPYRSAAQAWLAGQGSSRDFVHLVLALLRAMGVPARYVSGYFHPAARAAVGARAAGEAHAWAEAWVGRWQAFDPAKRAPVAHRHVVVARGRDYADVAPLRAVYSGPPASRTQVTVELERLA